MLMLLKFVLWLMALAFTAGIMLTYINKIHTTGIKKITPPHYHNINQQLGKGAQDFRQGVTNWDVMVLGHCATEAHKRHLKRGGGADVYFHKKWLQDITKCQKDLGFKAKDRRDI